MDRNGRAGKKGEALLILAPFEELPMRLRLEGYGVQWERANDPYKSNAQNVWAQERRGPGAQGAVGGAVRDRRGAADAAEDRG